MHDYIIDMQQTSHAYDHVINLSLTNKRMIIFFLGMAPPSLNYAAFPSIKMVEGFFYTYMEWKTMSFNRWNGCKTVAMVSKMVFILFSL